MSDDPYINTDAVATTGCKVTISTMAGKPRSDRSIARSRRSNAKRRKQDPTLKQATQPYVDRRPWMMNEYPD